MSKRRSSGGGMSGKTVALVVGAGVGIGGVLYLLFKGRAAGAATAAAAAAAADRPRGIEGGMEIPERNVASGDSTTSDIVTPAKAQEQAQAWRNLVEAQRRERAKVATYTIRPLSGGRDSD